MLKNENKNMMNFLELEFMLRNIHFNDWYDNQYSVRNLNLINCLKNINCTNLVHI